MRIRISRMSASTRLLVLSAMLSCVGSVGAASAGAQGCDNQDSIYQGGQYCIEATNPTTGNNPWMPVLSYSYGQGSCNTYTLELDFQQPNNSNLNSGSFGVYHSSDPGQAGGSLPGNVPWIVNWSLNDADEGEYSEGGNGGVSTYLSTGYAGTIEFQVWGQNPTTASITSLLNQLGAPWWYGHALTWETLGANPTGAGYGYLGNVQFYGLSQFGPGMAYTGTPTFGGPDGFGLSQLDGSPGANPSLVTDDSLWTWTTNLMYGVQVASQNQNSANNYFEAQYTQWLNDTGGNSQYPEAIPGYCNLSVNGTGNNAYWNADWIQMYNGGHWATWNGPTVGWTYHAPPSPSSPQYPFGVCSQQSYTI